MDKSLEYFQEINQCSKCKYCDLKAYAESKPCCTYYAKLEFDGNICKTHERN